MKQYERIRELREDHDLTQAKSGRSLASAKERMRIMKWETE